MKAIIELGKKGSVFKAARAQAKAVAAGETPDYRLYFESARMLFAELTPARIDLLDVLRRCGPCSVYALAKAAGRNYSNVHADVARLTELGLVHRTDNDSVMVPFSEVDIRLPLATAA